MEQRSNALIRIAVPLTSLLQRFMYLGLILLAFGLMLFSKVDVMLVDRVRAEVTDAFAPILEALSRPLATVSDGMQIFQSLNIIRENNIFLKTENAHLMQWQAVARKLRAENLALQQLLGMVKDQNAIYTTARIIAGSGGALSNMLVVNSGEKNGIRKGQVVISDLGVIGRISEVSSRSSRIRLLSDINSRVPVLIENNRTRAIVAGNNAAGTKLIHLPQGARVTLNARIITSGHGGAFPPGLPVGIVSSVGDSEIKIQLFVDFSRLEYVRIADFGLDGLEDLLDLSIQKRSGLSKVGRQSAKK